jgi:hypothetical protein
VIFLYISGSRVDCKENQGFLCKKARVTYGGTRFDGGALGRLDRCGAAARHQSGASAPATWRWRGVAGFDARCAKNRVDVCSRGHATWGSELGARRVRLHRRLATTEGSGSGVPRASGGPRALALPPAFAKVSSVSNRKRKWAK